MGKQGGKAKKGVVEKYPNGSGVYLRPFTGSGKGNFFRGVKIFGCQEHRVLAAAKKDLPKGATGYPGDLGWAFSFLGPLKIPEHPRHDNKDLAVLTSWVEHLDVADVPYIVVRTGPKTVELWKIRNIWHTYYETKNPGHRNYKRRAA